MRKIIFLFLIFALLNLNAQSLPNKRELITYRTNEKIKIDGKNDEKTWQNAPISGNFIQFTPKPDQKASVDTKVQVAYDDVALYVFATITDNPDSIYKIFTPRDQTDEADFFGILLDPYNDGLKAYAFSVSAAGVQADASFSGDAGDNNWNAVWYSAVHITKTGWQVEIKIPYSELRFPKLETQLWGVNFYQNIRRNREMAAWNPIDVKIDNFIIQNGTLKGIKNIKPPLRLSFLPYTAGYLVKSEDENSWGTNIKGGLDLKYGINEAFTLDMMLIPDFGQVESDDQVLNLSPYETYYDEKRSFFMENTDLFKRARIFYSRRIGNTPDGYDDVYDELKNNEKVTLHPSQLQLLNATKITGKTASGISIGFLNAVSGKSYATIEDTLSGQKRQYLMQGLTNYNVSIVEKSLKNNSYISLINANRIRFDNQDYSNVVGTQTAIYTPSNIYQFKFKGAISYKSMPEFDKNAGFKANTEFEKVKGNLRFKLENNIESETFDPNDLGYIQQNNEFSNEIEAEYQVFKPRYFYNNWNFRLRFHHIMLYNPFTYSKSFLSMNGHITLKNNMSMGFFSGRSLTDEHDYFEPRTDGYVYIQPSDFFYQTWFSTNYAKDFAIDFGVGGVRNFTWYSYNNSFSLSPRLRIGNKFSTNYRFRYSYDKGSRGYVDNTDTEVIFGRRNLETITNSLNLNYIINKDASFSLRFRHYWSNVQYQQFYTLQTTGALVNNDVYAENQDINFNALTINANLTWQFLPGSEMVLVWKKELLNSDETNMNYNYIYNFKQSLSLPQTNSISLKIKYYLDYQNLKKIF